MAKLVSPVIAAKTSVLTAANLVITLALQDVPSRDKDCFALHRVEKAEKAARARAEEKARPAIDLLHLPEQIKPVP